MALFGMMMLSNAAMAASLPSALTDLLANERRGVGMAAYFITTVIMGMGLAPVLIGFVNDRVFGGAALGAAIACPCGIAACVGLGAAWLGQRGYDRALLAKASLLASAASAARLPNPAFS
jgi:MFS family permease